MFKSRSILRALAAGNLISFYQMYAIVDIAGQQFKVEAGSEIFVNRLASKKDESVEFNKVLLIENNGAFTVGAPVVEGAKVIVEVLNNSVRGEKVLVFHKKRRKGYKKLNGHRQNFTQVLVKEIVNA